ncbi:cadherin-related family member 5-like isoform X2 [Oryzias latipes]|nr:cadherin-related family member 5-like isoform X2 [Oryzias latipes]XP_020556098.1 cadherin-related family member 5-like isoform X2 [Oryzias latipes]
MRMLRLCRLLLWQLAVRASCHLVAGLCRGGSDIFASVRENSPKGQFISNISIGTDPGARPVRLCLTGRNADWFYLEGRSIRLNSSASRVLDREVHGSVLKAELTCYEHDVMQIQNRILVEILNVNDNKPVFLQESIQPLSISELAAVDSVLFSVKAVDADGDEIRYDIDRSSADTWFFRIDVPNSGEVVLNKPLDFESRTCLQLVLWAEEWNTVERFNVSAVLTINVQDGDDQYPHFLPCMLVSQSFPVCMNPVYTANISHKHQFQDKVLEFSPGPIKAQDGDRGINCPLTYSILSGDEGGRFVIDNRTGELRITGGVKRPRLPSTIKLNIMVCQVDDPLKYSVATVLVRVLGENMFPPVFNRTTFKGFIIQNSSPASIVSTYGNQVLQVQALDPDFSDGLNQNIRYFLLPPSGLYQVTQEGVLIGRTDQLQAFDRHVLQVVARDEESGEEASALVDVEVLQRGQAVPRGAFMEQQLFADVDSRLAVLVSAVVLLMVLLFFLFVLVWISRRSQAQNPEEPVSVGKRAALVHSDPSVSESQSLFSGGTSSGHGEPSLPSESLHGREGVYTRRPSMPPPPSSQLFLRETAGRRPFQSDLCTVLEKPEGGAHTRTQWAHLRLQVSPEGT